MLVSSCIGCNINKSLLRTSQPSSIFKCFTDNSLSNFLIEQTWINRIILNKNWHKHNFRRKLNNTFGAFFSSARLTYAMFALFPSFWINNQFFILISLRRTFGQAKFIVDKGFGRTRFNASNAISRIFISNFENFEAFD